MIGIIGAMEEEIFAIKQMMVDVETVGAANLTFYEGKLENKQVVLVKSGIGKTLSALTTTALALSYDLSLVINIGTAGSLSDKLKALDVVVSNQVAQGDFDLTQFGYRQSFNEKRIAFKADDKTINIFKKLDLDNVVIGDIVSSDTFISDKKQAESILEKFPTALCADMEAGSIAMTLNHFNIPFIIIRSISDAVGSSTDSAIEFKDYLKNASLNSANITSELIKNL